MGAVPNLSTIIIRALPGRITLRLPLDIRDHDRISLLRLLLDALIVELAIVIQEVLLEGPLAQDSLGLARSTSFVGWFVATFSLITVFLGGFGVNFGVGGGLAV